MNSSPVLLCWKDSVKKKGQDLTLTPAKVGRIQQKYLTVTPTGHCGRWRDTSLQELKF